MIEEGQAAGPEAAGEAEAAKAKECQGISEEAGRARETIEIAVAEAENDPTGTERAAAAEAVVVVVAAAVVVVVAANIDEIDEALREDIKQWYYLGLARWLHPGERASSDR